MKRRDDDDLMAPFGPPDPPWHGSIPHLSCSRERHKLGPTGTPGVGAGVGVTFVPDPNYQWRLREQGEAPDG